MADQSAFVDLDDAQLHYLKAQYLASLQMVDQTEAALKAQLEQVGSARKLLQGLMQEIDGRLAGDAAPSRPATAAKGAAKGAAKEPAKPAASRRVRSRRVTP
jgi:hypothetical protein